MRLKVSVLYERGNVMSKSSIELTWEESNQAKYAIGKLIQIAALASGDSAEIRYLQILTDRIDELQNEAVDKLLKE